MINASAKANPTVRVVIELTQEEYTALLKASSIKQRAYFDQAKRYVVKCSFNDIENDNINRAMHKQALETIIQDSSIPFSPRPGIDYPLPPTPPKDPLPYIDPFLKYTQEPIQVTPPNPTLRDKVQVAPNMYLDPFIHDALVSLATEQHRGVKDVIEEALNTWTLPQTHRPKN